MRGIGVIGMLALGACGRLAFDPVTIESATNDATNDVNGPPMIARVQATTPAFLSSPGITRDMAVTVDNVVVAIAYWNNAGATVAITDTSSHTWTATPRQSIPTGCNNNIGTNVQIFYAPIVRAGTTSILAAQSTGAEPLGLFTVEYSGISTLDTQAGMIAPAASNAMTAGVVSTTGFDLIVAGFHDSVGSGTMQAGAGLTTLATDTISYALFAEVIGPAGAYNINGTLPAGRNDACWVGTAAAFHAR